MMPRLLRADFVDDAPPPLYDQLEIGFSYAWSLRDGFVLDFGHVRILNARIEKPVTPGDPAASAKMLRMLREQIDVLIESLER